MTQNSMTISLNGLNTPIKTHTQRKNGLENLIQHLTAYKNIKQTEIVRADIYSKSKFGRKSFNKSILSKRLGWP